jgi:hypothetical protein
MRILYRNFKKSARLLAHELGVRALHVERVSYHHDDDFWYGVDRDGISILNKFYQRVFLREELSLPVPRSIHKEKDLDGVSLSDEWVVRPLSHFGGSSFVLSSEPSENPFEYSSVYFDKTREYRFLFVKGTLVSIYTKTPRSEDVDTKGAWNHSSGNFRFISTTRESYAGRKFNIAETLENAFHDRRWPDIIAFDVGYNPDAWVVFEMNFAPALTELSLQHVKRRLQDA